MRNLRHLGIMALAAGLLTTSACSGNDRGRNLPGVFRPSVGERDGRDRDGDGNRDARPDKDKGRRDETRCNAGRGNGNGNGRCRNGNSGNGRNP
jgi:hypothetical protein